MVGMDKFFFNEHFGQVERMAFPDYLKNGIMKNTLLISFILVFFSLSCSTSKNYDDKRFLISRNTHKIWYNLERRQGVIFYDTTKTVRFFDENYFLMPLQNVDGIYYHLYSDTIYFKYRPFQEAQTVLEKFVILELSNNHLCLYNEKWDTISLDSYTMQDTLPLTNPEFSDDYLKAQPVFSDRDVVALLDSINIDKKELRNYRLVLYIDSHGSVEDAMILRNNKATLPLTIEEQKMIEAIREKIRYKPASDKRTGRNYSSKILFELKRYL